MDDNFSAGMKLWPFVKDVINYLVIPMAGLVAWVWKKGRDIVKKQEQLELEQRALEGEFMSHLNNCPTSTEIRAQFKEHEKETHEYVDEKIKSTVTPLIKEQEKSSEKIDNLSESVHGIDKKIDILIDRDKRKGS